MNTRIGFTGSSFFGGAGRGSDFDFYAQDSVEVRARLLAEGFRPLKQTGVCGPNVIAVYRKGEGSRHIDIGLTRSFERKHFENRIMALTPLRLINRFASKRTRTKVWGIVQKL